MPESVTLCPCGSKLAFAACCQPFLDGALAPTAEALMRSRYSAFATGHADHIVRTHTKPTSPEQRAELEAWCKATRWLFLTVVKTEKGTPKDFEGWVEFQAHFLEDGEAWVLEERSRFEKHDGRWLYVDGDGRRHRERKAGRSEPCPCGSGKRFKHCHGA
jgi:SEC-C motif-containing protein